MTGRGWCLRDYTDSSLTYDLQTKTNCVFFRMGVQGIGFSIALSSYQPNIKSLWKGV